MAKINKTKNRAIVRNIVLVIVVLILGVGGVSSFRSIFPYADWKTANLKYEKLKVRFPLSWTVARQTEGDIGVNFINPGTDFIDLRSPDKLLNVQITTGNVGLYYTSLAYLKDPKPLKIIGNQYYLTSVKDYSDDRITSALQILNQTTKSGLPTKFTSTPNICQPNPSDYKCTPGSTLITVSYNAPTPQQIQVYYKNPYYKQARLIIESLHY
jgi:hypothetical protein